MRYFITCAYHGKNYHGWQIQPNATTVQEIFEDRLSTFLGKKTAVYAAGRTDTGVHASKMMVHIDADILDLNNFIYRMNAFLPKDIAILGIQKVIPSAHARFDAKKRTYHYFIHYKKNPFILEKSWYWYADRLNLDWMNDCAAYLTTVDDFTSFARLHADNKTNLCDVQEAFWTTYPEGIRFTITADRFLRNMVRAIVGTLADVGKGNISKAEFIEIIAKKDRNFASASAPAHGLFLADIAYADEIYL